jgi:omega-hydroxy-beta-dihydromenaquinone-9 sulfotransferase
MGTSLANLFRLAKNYGSGLGLAFYASALARSPFMLADWAWGAGKKPAIEAPVFILGHWRSGTTHLYNVLAKAEGFAWVSPFATALPLDWVSLTRLFKPLLAKRLPKGRFIDQMDVTAASPQEDEFALANLQPLSFLHGLYFPKDFQATFNRGLFFEGAGEDEIARWRAALTRFYRKLAATQAGKTLLIKNPVYTARVKELLALFPDARFIHIHRNPYKIFFSMRNFYAQLFSELALQTPNARGLDEHIFATYSRMMETLEHDTAELPENQVTELSYERLVAEPVAALAEIYRALKIPGFDRDIERFNAYLETVKNFRQNIYRFPEADLQAIEREWGHFIEKWGYTRPGEGA